MSVKCFSGKMCNLKVYFKCASVLNMTWCLLIEFVFQSWRALYIRFILDELRKDELKANVTDLSDIVDDCIVWNTYFTVDNSVGSAYPVNNEREFNKSWVETELCGYSLFEFLYSEVWTTHTSQS